MFFPACLALVCFSSKSVSVKRWRQVGAGEFTDEEHVRLQGARKAAVSTPAKPGMARGGTVRPSTPRTPATARAASPGVPSVVPMGGQAQPRRTLKLQTPRGESMPGLLPNTRPCVPRAPSLCKANNHLAECHLTVDKQSPVQCRFCQGWSSALTQDSSKWIEAVPGNRGENEQGSQGQFLKRKGSLYTMSCAVLMRRTVNHAVTVQ